MLASLHVSSFLIWSFLGLPWSSFCVYFFLTAQHSDPHVIDGFYYGFVIFQPDCHVSEYEGGKGMLTITCLFLPHLSVYQLSTL